MKRKTQYDAIIKLRVTGQEKTQIADKARALQQTVSEFVRQRVLEYRVRLNPHAADLVRHISRIGANLNQLARWANTHKSNAEAMEVIFALADIEAELQTLTINTRLEDANAD